MLARFVPVPSILRYPSDTLLLFRILDIFQLNLLQEIRPGTDYLAIARITQCLFIQSRDKIVPKMNGTWERINDQVRRSIPVGSF
jgi:hypothetical protein